MLGCISSLSSISQAKNLTGKKNKKEAVQSNLAAQRYSLQINSLGPAPLWCGDQGQCSGARRDAAAGTSDAHQPGPPSTARPPALTPLACEGSGTGWADHS